MGWCALTASAVIIPSRIGVAAGAESMTLGRREDSPPGNMGGANWPPLTARARGVYCPSLGAWGSYVSTGILHALPLVHGTAATITTLPGLCLSVQQWQEGLAVTTLQQSTP